MSFQDNTTSEEEYFHKLAQEQLNKLREVAAIEDAEAAAKAAKEAPEGPGAEAALEAAAAAPGEALVAGLLLVRAARV